MLTAPCHYSRQPSQSTNSPFPFTSSADALLPVTHTTGLLLHAWCVYLLTLSAALQRKAEHRASTLRNPALRWPLPTLANTQSVLLFPRVYSAHCLTDIKPKEREVQNLLLSFLLFFTPNCIESLTLETWYVWMNHLRTELHNNCLQKGF